MFPRIPFVKTFLFFFFLLSLFSSCEVRKQETPPSPIPSLPIPPPSRSFPSSLPLLPLYGENGFPIGNGLLVKKDLIFFQGLISRNEPIFAQTPQGSPIPLTEVVYFFVFSLYTPSTPLPVTEPPPMAEEVKVGETLFRYYYSPPIEERELLQVVGIYKNRIYLTCPRTLAGYLFNNQGQAVLGFWIPDPRGGCGIFLKLSSEEILSNLESSQPKKRKKK